MKKLLLLSLLIITTLSCSSESTSNRLTDNTQLLGKWSLEVSEINEDITVYHNEPCLNTKLEFREDRRLIYYIYSGIACTEHLTFNNYTVQNGKIITDTEIIKILRINSETMKLKYSTGEIQTYLKL